MNVFEKIIEKLEEISELIRPVGWSRKIEVVEMKAIIEIINEVAAEHNNGWKTVVNEEIKNPFANISTVGCVNCEHKDEYIIELEEDNNGWIPCSERLPETEEYILLSFENFSLPQIGRYEQDDFGGAFYLSDELTTCTSYELFVNAWQPLPEPYEEREKCEVKK